MDKLHVFISYTMRDREISLDFLRSVKMKLNDVDTLDVYIDILDNAGDNHQAYVMEKLAEADIVLLILSTRTDRSAWVKTELDFAETRHTPVIRIHADEIRRLLSAPSGAERLSGLLTNTACQGRNDSTSNPAAS